MGIKLSKGIVGGLAAAAIMFTAACGGGLDDTIKTGPYEGQKFSEALAKNGIDVPEDYFIKVCGYIEMPAKDGDVDDDEFERLLGQVGRDMKMNPLSNMLDAGDVGSVIGASLATGCEEYGSAFGLTSSYNNT